MRCFTRATVVALGVSVVGASFASRMQPLAAAPSPRVAERARVAPAQQPQARRSPHETTKGVVDGAALTITYGRPLMRGRKIVGELVPFGHVWRLGADEATELSTSAALVFGTHRLKAGKYSLFAKPEKDAWTLIINAGTGMSGLEREPEKDLTSITARPVSLAAPVEQLTLGIVDTPAGGAITLRWERTEVTFPFTVAK
jgi:hypothetical protein